MSFDSSVFARARGLLSVLDMEAPTLPHDPASTTCAPYRAAPVVEVAPPRSKPSRALTVASWLMMALAVAAMATSMRLTRTLSDITRLAVTSRLAARTVRPAPRLAEAVEELSRRHRAPLFIEPGLDAGALNVAVADGADGALRASTRALDGYAATRGLWLHDDGGVLRLEREVTAVDLSCVGSLEDCAARFERLASVTVERAAASSGRLIRVRVTRDVPVVDALRAALVAAGYQVDVAGRTLYVSDGALDARAEGPASTGVRAIGRGLYAVSRQGLDAALNDQQALMRSTRILPVERGGRVVGVQVFGVRPGDLLARLGVESGDTILRLNQFDIASPDRCLEAYARLRASDEITVELERAGRRVSLRYVIV